MNNSNVAITVKYGVESIQKLFPSPVTVAQLKASTSVRAALGYGDNVNVVLDGVVLSDNTEIPNGTTVTIETRCNSKAGL